MKYYYNSTRQIATSVFVFGMIDIFFVNDENWIGNKMSPEFLMGDISQPEVGEIKSTVKQEPKPRVNGHGHWSPFEIQEWRKKISETFDQMAHLGDVAQFEKAHGVEQHPKPNGMQRLTSLGSDLEKAVKVRTGEEDLGQEPLGYGPAVNLPTKESEAQDSGGH